MTLIAPRALYLSPSASHPRDYGNRNRVWQTSQFLQSLGFEIHFLLYPMESDWSRSIPPSAGTMRECWTSFSVIPPSKPMHARAAARYHEIDEWWDPHIGDYLAWLFARQHYDVFFVNYTFLSKAFDYAPSTTTKILETHDLFSGRLEMLEKVGAEPEFFYTTISEEQHAFARADVVLAIKDSEAAFIRKHSRAQVISLPFFPDQPKTAPGTPVSTQSETLRVGFIGALNTVNVLNMQRFLDAFRRFERVFTPPLLIKIAGDVCSRLAAGRTVQLLGKVESVEEYYAEIDVFVAPLMFSTGLKIKVAEALCFGKPVVATQNAFDGFQATDEFHALTSYNDVCQALVKLAFDRDRLAKLTERSAVASRLARGHRDTGFRKFGDTLRPALLRILFVTDKPIWKRNSLDASRLAQWADLCADILPTIVIYTGSERVPSAKPDSLKALAVIGLPMASAEDVVSAVRGGIPGAGVAEIVLAVSNTDVLLLLNVLKVNFRYFSIDVRSSPTACAELMGNAAGGKVDILCAEAKGNELVLTGISVVPLRYLPIALHGATPSRADSIVAALCGPTPNDLSWLEVLRRRISDKRLVTIVGREAGEHEILERELFGYIQQHGKPSMVIAVGAEQRMVSVYQALARYLGADFERLSGSDLPRIRVNRHGRLIFCETLDDEIQCIADDQLRNSVEKKDASDGGWSSYWQMLQARRTTVASSSAN